MKFLNPAKGWHHLQVRDPKTWQIVGTIQLGRKAEATDRSDFGIQARIGRKGGKGPSRSVVLLFDPRLWTLARAKKWARDHGETVLEASEASDQPSYALSGRARAIGHDRRESDVVREYRQDMLRVGAGVDAASVNGKGALEAASKKGLGACMEFALKHGRFSDGERKLLIVPQDLLEFVTPEKPSGKKQSGKMSSRKRSSAGKPKAGREPRRTKKRVYFSVSPFRFVGERQRALPFPEDMLRYDQATLVGDQEREKADARESGVLLVSDHAPTADRWASFGWKVDWARKGE